MASVTELLNARAGMVKVLQYNLLKAKRRMKVMADKKRSERVLLYPCGQVTASVRKNIKLISKFYAPYKVIKRIGSVAYEL